MSAASPAIVPVTPTAGGDVVFALAEFAPRLAEFAPPDFAGSLELTRSECQGQKCLQISSGHECGSGGCLSSVFASVFASSFDAVFAAESVAGVAGSVSDPHKRHAFEKPEYVTQPAMDSAHKVINRSNGVRSGKSPRR